MPKEIRIAGKKDQDLDVIDDRKVDHETG